jgi:choline monooxygenase
MQPVLNASFLKEFDQDGGIKHGLPGAAYISEEFNRLENSHLFTKSWVFVAFAHKIPKVGDVLPVNVGDQPMFILRNEAGKIVAFHNVCRHRNLKLIDQQHNCGRLIRCPYHSWSYDLRGQLKNAPYFGGEAKQAPTDFDPAENGLTAVRCEVWHDWVFINLGDDAMSFEDFLKPIKKQLGDNDITQYRSVTTVELGVVKTNWKLLMENFIEPYHVQFVHKTTTSQPLVDHYTVIEDHCLGSAVDLTEGQQVAAAGNGTLGVTSRYLTLFPNFVLGTYQPDQIGVHLNSPIDANTTTQTRVIYVHKDSVYSDEQIQQLHDLWYSVHLEDHAMCERLQQGRHSSLASAGGILSPHWETSVRKFQELVADAIRPALTD